MGNNTNITILFEARKLQSANLRKKICKNFLTFLPAGCCNACVTSATCSETLKLNQLVWSSDFKMKWRQRVQTITIEKLGQKRMQKWKRIIQQEPMTESICKDQVKVTQLSWIHVKFSTHSYRLSDNWDLLATYKHIFQPLCNWFQYLWGNRTIWESNFHCLFMRWR